MKINALLITTLLLSACAAQDQKQLSTQDELQAVRDFIAVRNLAEVNSMRVSNSDSWTEISGRFLVYKGGRRTHLVEFNRRCIELESSSRIVPDRRWELNTVRPRFDTLRGCRIDKIYALSEAEAEELEHIGEPPGSRN
jgi:hypothetical protein